ERNNDAGEPLLLGQHREDEIVVSDRKKPKLTLSSLLETFAGEASRSDGDARLNLLVSGAFRVLGWIEKRRDAALVVVLHRERPRDGRRQKQTEKQQAENAHLHAGQIADCQTDRQQRDGCAEVGLLGNQREGQHSKNAATREISPGRRTAVLAEKLGQHQGHADLGKLRWLEIERSQ